MFFLRPKFVITLAIISGLLAAYGVYHYLQRHEAQTASVAAPTYVSQRVVVAARDIPMGTTLDPTHLQIRQWPENLIPAGSFEQAEDLISRVARISLVAGEPILEAKLAPMGSTGGFSTLIPPGKRAVTVAVNVVSGVAGFLLPGTRVDVLVTVSLSGKAEERVTRTILQNVEVMAVDQTFQKDDEDPIQVKSVTLLVSPEEAEALSLAANEGVLHLALRSGADEEAFPSAGVKLGELMKPSKTTQGTRVVRRTVYVPAPEPPTVTRVIEVIRGNKSSEVTFEEKRESESPEEKPEPSESKQ